MTKKLQSHFSIEPVSLPDLTPSEKAQLQITPGSYYGEDIWTKNNEVGQPDNIHFSGDFKDVLKELVFNNFSFCLENNKPKSWATQKNRVENFKLIINNLFEPNGITIHDIPDITYGQMEVALKKAKASDFKTHYNSLSQILIHWRTCVQLESISPEYQLNVSACKAIIEHKSKMVKADNNSGFKPFDYDQIETLWGDFNQRIKDGLEGFHKKDKTLRAACMSAILLISGMRIRELRFLKKGCCVETTAGNYELKLTRFKTSANTIVGEEDIIPTTKIIYDACLLLETFSDKYTFTENSDFLITRILNQGDPNTGMDISRLRVDLANYGKLLKISPCHPHRFRKSIAWLLISMDEENIALLRHLLGHKSYAMTLEYISRNPELVNCIKAIYKERYSEELSQIINSILDGKYSGKGADRIAESYRGKNAIKPQMVSQTIDEIITILIESGEPLFLQRTPMGIYCLTVPSVAGDPPPCLVGLPSTEKILPKIRNCKWETCGGAICIPGKNSYLESNIEHNLAYYKKQLKIENCHKKLKKELNRLIKLNTEHLKNMRTDRSDQFKTENA